MNNGIQHLTSFPSQILDLQVDEEGNLIVTTETGMSKLTQEFLEARLEEGS